MCQSSTVRGRHATGTLVSASPLLTPTPLASHSNFWRRQVRWCAAKVIAIISSVCVYKHTARGASVEHKLSLSCSQQFAVLSAAVRRSRGAPIRWRHARDRCAAPPTQPARAPERRRRLPRACCPTSAGAGDLRGARTNRRAQSPNGRRESGAASCGRRLRSRCRRAGHTPAAPGREGRVDPKKKRRPAGR